MYAKKTNRLMIVLFSMALILVFTACGGQSESDAPPSTEPAQEQAAQPSTQTENTVAPALAATEANTEPSEVVAELAEAATVYQVAQLLDMRSLSLPDGVEPMGHPEVGSLNYQAPIGVNEVISFYGPLLASQGWQEIEGQGYRDTAYATLYFTQKDFIISLSASDMGGGQTMVTLMHHGNIDLRALPQTTDAEQLTYAPNTMIYFSPTGVSEVAQFIHSGLTAQGWQEYTRPNTATADDPARRDMNFIQNGLELSASVSEAPAQGGKTAVQYSILLLPLDLPVADQAAQLEFDKHEPYVSYKTSADQNTLLTFYQEQMAAAGWQPLPDFTATSPKQANLAYANEAEQLALLIELAAAGDNQTRVTLHSLSADETLADAGDTSMDTGDGSSDDVMAGSSGELPPFPLPEDAQTVEYDDGSLTFSSPSDVETLMEFYRDALVADNWQEQSDFSQVDDTFAFVEFDQGDEAVYITIIAFGDASEATIDLSSAPSLMGSTAISTASAGGPGYTIADWPTPPDAKEVKTSGDTLSFKVTMPIAELAEFYRPTYEMMALDTGCLDDVADYTSMSCSFSNGDFSLNFFAFEGFDDTEVEIEFVNYALGSTGGSSGELGVTEEYDLPLPDDNTGYSAEGSEFGRKINLTSPSNLETLVEFFQTELASRGWTLDDSDQSATAATLRFSGPDGELVVTLQSGAETEVALTVKNPTAAKEAGVLPPTGQARVYLVNFSDGELTVTINGQVIKIPAGAGVESPDDAPNLDLPPGTYDVTTQVGSSSVTDQVTVGPDESWGLLLDQQGALPLQIY